MKRYYAKTADRAIDQLREIVNESGSANVIVAVEDLELVLGEIDSLRDVIVIAGVQLEKTNAAFAVPTDLVEAEVRYATHVCRRALTGLTTEPVRR